METFLNDIFSLKEKDDERLGTKVFKDIKQHLEIGKEIWLKDDESKEGSFGTITYVGTRFCTVKLKKGHSVSVNYASMIDKNNKDIHSTIIKI
jgi:hypothetical protein